MSIPCHSLVYNLNYHPYSSIISYPSSLTLQPRKVLFDLRSSVVWIQTYLWGWQCDIFLISQYLAFLSWDHIFFRISIFHWTKLYARFLLLLTLFPSHVHWEYNCTKVWVIHLLSALLWDLSWSAILIEIWVLFIYEARLVVTLAKLFTHSEFWMTWNIFTCLLVS